MLIYTVKETADVIKVQDLKMGKLTWIMWVGPMESLGSF